MVQANRVQKQRGGGGNAHQKLSTLFTFIISQLVAAQTTKNKSKLIPSSTAKGVVIP